jgi:CheY-like chemotaxis protein
VSSPGRLLLVDDEPDIRKIATIALERIGGWEVTAAGSADEAEAAILRQMPDVVLLDVMMPGLDGPATLERLRPLLGPTPVIYMTGAPGDERLRGATGVIAKPFDPIGLSQQVAEITGR